MIFVAMNIKNKMHYKTNYF